MAYINKKWRKFMALGCSHGDMLSRSARNGVMKFKEGWNPSEMIHLGDFMDATAFRAGAKGTKDETIDLDTDLQEALSFLRDVAPTKLIVGNHDIRVYEATTHHNAIISKAAKSVVEEVRKLVKKQRIEYIEEYDIEGPRFRLGDTDFLHGFMYSENAIREHAEHFGRCVFAHLHKVGMATGRRSDTPTAYCVGLMADIKLMKYANRRRATTQWANGFAFGEFSDSSSAIFLAQADKEGVWRLPGV